MLQSLRERLTQLETRTQEVTLLLSVVLALTLLASGLFFLFLEPTTLQGVTGDQGSLGLSILFKTFGYAAFYLPVAILALGQLLLARVHHPDELPRAIPTVLAATLYHVSMAILLASFLTVFSLYGQWLPRMGLPMGAGGMSGTLLGGQLFDSIGVFGALVSLSSITLLAGIILGQINLVNLILGIEENIRLLIRLTLKVIIGLAHRVLARFDVLVLEGLNEQLGHPLPKQERHRPKLPDHVQPGLTVEQVQTAVTQAVQANLALKADAIELTEVSPAPAIMPVKDVMGEPAASEPQAKQQPKVEEAEPENKPTVEIKPYTKRYAMPELSLLKSVSVKEILSKKELESRKANLEERLESFQIRGSVVAAHVGPRLTMYEFQPDAGVKLSKIAGLATDLALLLGANSLRMLTPIPGKTTVGIEVDNPKASPVPFADLMKSVKKDHLKKKVLPIALGKDVYNDIIVKDLAEMPHLLVSGTTGSGKSVFINTLITGLLFTRSPKELRFLMIDPKMIELSPYNGIPHLLKPVVTDLDEAKDVLVWAEKEMDNRYARFAEVGARNITSFNSKIKSSTKTAAERRAGRKLDWNWQEMPYIVIVIDEMADLMITQGKDVEIPITSIAQKARACGIHIVMATQRPSAEIVTGLIKTNFPTRIAFKVSSAIDSRTILDAPGAEKLLGQGDMLHLSGGGAMARLQASFLSEDEVKKIVSLISKG